MLSQEALQIIFSTQMDEVVPVYLFQIFMAYSAAAGAAADKAEESNTSSPSLCIV